MIKLRFEEPNKFFITHKKDFNPSPIASQNLEKSIDFAYNMSFGSGHHRNTRTGGSLVRKNGEIFSNAFQGKISEFVLFDFFQRNQIISTEVDVSILGEGDWDDSDLIIGPLHLNVKSAAYFSNLLLLESDDWDNKGHYIPNIQSNATYKYDYFILVRIKPDIKALLKLQSLFYSNIVDMDTLRSLIQSKDWFYDLPGFITLNQLRDEVIGQNQIIPRGGLLNGKVTMDASNYYVQTGDMQAISDLVVILNGI